MTDDGYDKQRIEEANSMERQVFMIIKFLYKDKIYNFYLNERIVTSKHFLLQVFVITTLESQYLIFKKVPSPTAVGNLPILG